MEMGKETFFLVRADVLPESFHKTLEVKRILAQQAGCTIQEAVEKVGISRSVYYKYKDAVFPFNEVAKQKIITVSFHLEHRAGVLSQILTYLAAQGGNILTINQTIPLQGMANVVMSMDTFHMEMTITQFLEGLQNLDGVQKVLLIAQE